MAPLADAVCFIDSDQRDASGFQPLDGLQFSKLLRRQEDVLHLSFFYAFERIAPICRSQSAGPRRYRVRPRGIRPTLLGPAAKKESREASSQRRKSLPFYAFSSCRVRSTSGIRPLHSSVLMSFVKCQVWSPAAGYAASRNRQFTHRLSIAVRLRARYHLRGIVLLTS